VSTHITGKLILAGDYTEDEQIDPEAPLARVVIVMPRETLRDVASLPMFQDVTVIKTADLAEIQSTSENWRRAAELAQQGNRELIAEVELLKEDRTAALAAQECSNWKLRAQKAESELGSSADEPNPNGSACARIAWWKARSDDVNDANAALREALNEIGDENLCRHYDRAVAIARAALAQIELLVAKAHLDLRASNAKEVQP
jgi:hypothetical protein